MVLCGMSSILTKKREDGHKEGEEGARYVVLGKFGNITSRGRERCVRQRCGFGRQLSLSLFFPSQRLNSCSKF